MPAVVFIPSGKRIEVEAGTLLSDACRAAGFPLPAPCGGKGLCGKCRVQVLKGEVPLDGAQTACVNASLLVSGWRAACVTKIAGDLVVAEPSGVSGGAGGDAVALTDFQGRRPGHGGGFWSCDVALEPPAPGGAEDDAARLLAALKAKGATDGRRAIGSDGLRLSLLAELPRLLRERRFRCRVAGMGRHILGVRSIPEEAAGEKPALGLAVDLGTTTLAVALCDAATGEVFSVVGAANPQAAWGDDVVSRIEYAGRSRAHREEMRLAAVEKISSLADEARRKAGFGSNDRDNGGGDILVIAVAGNTVMNHLLLGVDPAALAVSPFVPAFTGAVEVWGRDIGWPEEANGTDPLVLVLPDIGSYVGGDVTAGLLAHDILRSKEPVLYIDVGTNGEMALVANGRALACATAAGPAFEGARIGQGMRAATGAVSRVDWTGEAFECEVIGGGRARGICGTGLLDAVAALLKAGIVDESGRMAKPEEAEEFDLSAEAAATVHMNGNMPAVWLVPPEGRLPGVEITQRDVRELQLAKGAMAAGVRVLLRKAGLPPQQIARVCLAGGFGSFLRPASASAVGLLPAGIAPERIKSVGNAALAGARLYLHSRDERRAAAEIRANVEYVELSGRHDFEIAFAEEMLFPAGGDGAI